MKKIKLLIFASILLSCFSVKAQEQLTSLQYSVGFGVGDFRDFINQESWRGATFEYRSIMEEKYSIGFDMGINTFYDNIGYATTTRDNATITGSQFRYMTAVPAMMTMDYYIGGYGHNDVTPYLGVGLGTLYSYSRLDMGIYSFTDDAWHFLVRPELGVLISTSSQADFIFAAKYNNAFKTQQDPSRSYLSLNVGFVWKY